MEKDKYSKLLLLLIIFWGANLKVGATIGSGNTSASSYITDPMIKTRCTGLLRLRDKKIKHKQKALALIARVNHLLKIAPINKKRATKQLRFTRTRLNQELKIIRFKIFNMEEDLVRKGCPAIRL